MATAHLTAGGYRSKTGARPRRALVADVQSDRIGAPDKVAVARRDQHAIETLALPVKQVGNLEVRSSR